MYLIGDETPRLDDDDTPSQMLSAKTPATEKRVESLLTPQVVRDIEKEIAQHTQEFDRSMLDKSNSKGELSSKVTYSSTKTPNEKSGSETAVSAEVKLKAKKLNLSAPIQATHVIQLIRLLAIITIAAISGTSTYFNYLMYSYNSNNNSAILLVFMYTLRLLCSHSAWQQCSIYSLHSGLHL